MEICAREFHLHLNVLIFWVWALFGLGLPFSFSQFLFLSFHCLSQTESVVEKCTTHSNDNGIEMKQTGKENISIKIIFIIRRDDSFAFCCCCRCFFVHQNHYAQNRHSFRTLTCRLFSLLSFLHNMKVELFFFSLISNIKSVNFICTIF